MAIQDSLISWWSMDEESGERADSHGSNPLTDNNTVLFDTGKVGNAADFEEVAEEYLSHVDNADLSFSGNDPFAIACWVNMESFDAAANRIVSKSLGAGDVEYRLSYRHSTERFIFEVSDDGTNVAVIEADDLGLPTVDTWYFVVGWHDPDADVIAIQINNGTPDTAAHNTGVHDDIGLFCVGILNVGESQGFDGLIDELGLWNRVLTADERTWLYNGGAGRAHGDWVGGDQVIWVL